MVGTQLRSIVHLLFLLLNLVFCFLSYHYILLYAVTAEEFYFYFAQYGEIIDSFIVYDRETVKPRGFGFVTFVDPAVCRSLLQIYEKENTSASEDEMACWNEDTETMEGSFSMSRPPPTRLQMRGRFIELKIAQPRGENYSSSKPPLQKHLPMSTRPSRPYQQQYQPQQHSSVVPRYYPNYTNNYNDSSIFDGEYDANKISATLSQQQHHTHHPYQYHPHHQPPPQPLKHRSPGFGYKNTPVPMTPGGPLSGGSQHQHHHHQRFSHQAPIMTPMTPAQTAMDIAHHMIFYAQLLATPSMASNTNYADMHYYQEDILRREAETATGSCANNKYYTPSQPPPRPCTPSLSVPEIIVSPTKKQATGVSEVFKIGSGTFYPDTTFSSSPTMIVSPRKVVSKEISSLLPAKIASV